VSKSKQYRLKTTYCSSGCLELGLLRGNLTRKRCRKHHLPAKYQIRLGLSHPRDDAVAGEPRPYPEAQQAKSKREYTSQVRGRIEFDALLRFNASASLYSACRPELLRLLLQWLMASSYLGRLMLVPLLAPMGYLQ